MSLLLVGVGGVFVYFLAKRFETVEPDPLPPTENSVAQKLDGPDPIEVAKKSMRARYRPGPYVNVMGLLPNGLIQKEAEGRKASIGTPFVVPGATYSSGDVPLPSITPTRPSLTILTATKQEQALTLIAGTPAKLKVNVQKNHSPIEGLLIHFENYKGHFFLPAVIDSELGTIRVDGKGDSRFHFGMGAPINPDGTLVADEEPLAVNMRVAAQTHDGLISDFVDRKIKVLPLGTGDVEVTLTMEDTTDLDLYVIDPTGAAVFYRGKSTESGGHLDLDANAMCEDHLGVNNEHVFWEKGKAPAGTYQVRVSHYESCVGGDPVDYRVTVRSCGETAVFAGNFVGKGRKKTCKADPGNDRVGCQKVVEFDVSPCEESLKAR